MVDSSKDCNPEGECGVTRVTRKVLQRRILKLPNMPLGVLCEMSNRANLVTNDDKEHFQILSHLYPGGPAVGIMCKTICSSHKQVTMTSLDNHF